MHSNGGHTVDCVDLTAPLADLLATASCVEVSWVISPHLLQVLAQLEKEEDEIYIMFVIHPITSLLKLCGSIIQQVKHVTIKRVINVLTQCLGLFRTELSNKID